MAPERGRDLTVAFAATVKEMRTARGWSQETLADASAVHRTFIGLVESGKRGISLGAAAGIARAFGVPLHQLIAAAERSVDNSDL